MIIIGIADISFFMAPDFREVASALMPHFRFAASFRLLNRFTEATYPFREPEERGEFVYRRFPKERQELEIDELIEKMISNVKWAINTGAIVTLGLAPYTDFRAMKSIGRIFRSNKPLYRYDVGNVLLAGEYGVPLWANKGVDEVLPELYSPLFPEVKIVDEVSFPIERFGEKFSANPLNKYVNFFEKLKSLIRSHNPTAAVRLVRDFVKTMSEILSDELRDGGKLMMKHFALAFLPLNVQIFDGHSVPISGAISGPLLVFINGFVRWLSTTFRDSS